MYFTVDEFLTNIEKNGLPQAFGGLFRDDNQRSIYINDNRTKLYSPNVMWEDKIGEACALGQGMINQGVSNISPVNINNDMVWQGIENRIVGLNDREGRSLKTIVSIIRKEFPKALDIKLRGLKFDYTPYLPDSYKPKNVGKSNG